MLSPIVTNDWQNNRTQVIRYPVLQATGRKMHQESVIWRTAEWTLDFPQYKTFLCGSWDFFEDGGGGDGKVWLELGSYKLLHTVLYAPERPFMHLTG